MHAPVLKRTTRNQFVGLALALGLAASVTLNVVMLVRSNDGAAQPVAAQTERAAPAQEPYSGPHQDSMEGGLLPADQVAIAPVRSQSQLYDMAFGQAIVAQMLADHRFAPTAMDLFVLDPAK